MRGVIIKQLAVFTRFWWEIFTRFCAFFGVFLVGKWELCPFLNT